MALFRDEIPVLGAATVVDDPTAASNALPKLIGSWVESQGPIDAAQAVSRAVFIAPYAVQVTNVQTVFGVAGGAAAAVTCEKLTGTQAPGGGTAVLSAAMSLTGAANTVATGTLIAAGSAALVLAAGDRLGLVFSGTQTGLVGLVVAIRMQKV